MRAPFSLNPPHVYIYRRFCPRFPPDELRGLSIPIGRSRWRNSKVSVIIKARENKNKIGTQVSTFSGTREPVSVKKIWCCAMDRSLMKKPVTFISIGIMSFATSVRCRSTFGRNARFSKRGFFRGVENHTRVPRFELSISTTTTTTTVFEEKISKRTDSSFSI